MNNIQQKEGSTTYHILVLVSRHHQIGVSAGKGKELAIYTISAYNFRIRFSRDDWGIRFLEKIGARIQTRGVRIGLTSFLYTK